MEKQTSLARETLLLSNSPTGAVTLPTPSSMSALPSFMLLYEWNPPVHVVLFLVAVAQHRVGEICSCCCLLVSSILVAK